MNIISFKGKNAQIHPEQKRTIEKILPDNTFKEIFSFLSLRECWNLRCLNKKFIKISEEAIDHNFYEKVDEFLFLSRSFHPKPPHLGLFFSITEKILAHLINAARIVPNSDDLLWILRRRVSNLPIGTIYRCTIQIPFVRSSIELSIAKYKRIHFHLPFHGEIDHFILQRANTAHPLVPPTDHLSISTTAERTIYGENANYWIQGKETTDSLSLEAIRFYHLELLMNQLIPSRQIETVDCCVIT